MSVAPPDVAKTLLIILYLKTTHLKIYNVHYIFFLRSHFHIQEVLMAGTKSLKFYQCIDGNPRGTNLNVQS